MGLLCELELHLQPLGQECSSFIIGLYYLCLLCSQCAGDVNALLACILLCAIVCVCVCAFEVIKKDVG